MPGSTVDELKKVIKQYEPERFTERRPAPEDDLSPYQRIADPKPGLGKFMPATLPGDMYVDKDKRKNLERVLEGQKNFSHKAFILGNQPVEKGRHGGWEGTFASRHGGYPHMFETLAPAKSDRWLGQVPGKHGGQVPMLVRFPSQSGPGQPGRCLGGDPTYESEFNYDKVEKMNRDLRLGMGNGYRTYERKAAHAPWMTTKVYPGTFDENAPYQEVSVPEPGKRLTCKATQLAARVAHHAPFISAAPERKLPLEAFGTYAYMEEEYIDNTSRRFDQKVKEEMAARDKKRGVKPIHHPPFKSSGPSILSKTSPSVMFRRK